MTLTAKNCITHGKTCPSATVHQKFHMDRPGRYVVDNVERSSPYRAVNTPRFDDKNQSVNVV